MTKKSIALLTTSPKSHHSHPNCVCYPLFLNCEQNKSIWLKKMFLIFAENGGKSLEVFDNWLRIGKNYLG